MVKPCSNETNGLYFRARPAENPHSWSVIVNKNLQLLTDILGQSLQKPRQALFAAKAQHGQYQTSGRETAFLVPLKQLLRIH